MTNKKDYIIILHVTVPIKKYYGKKKEVKKKLRLKLKFELKNEIPAITDLLFYLLLSILSQVMTRHYIETFMKAAQLLKGTLFPFGWIHPAFNPN